MAKKLTIWIILLGLLIACSDERELSPSEGNHLRNLSIRAGYAWLNVFYNYDYYLATNCAGGGSLEGQTLISAQITTTQSRSLTITAWYPDNATIISSNLYPANTSFSVSFGSTPIYYYSNQLRIRIYNQTDREEVLDASW